MPPLIVPQTEDFSAISVTESHNIYSRLLEAPWALIREKDGMNRYKSQIEGGGSRGNRVDVSMRGDAPTSVG